MLERRGVPSGAALRRPSVRTYNANALDVQSASTRDRPSLESPRLFICWSVVGARIDKRCLPPR